MELIIMNDGAYSLIQVTKEERGNKGAALTTFLSLAGRYCVLMPNSANSGGISKKIPFKTRKKMKDILLNTMLQIKDLFQMHYKFFLKMAKII